MKAIRTRETRTRRRGGCQPRARPDSVSFKAKLPAHAPWTVAFSAHGTAPHGPIVSYTWYFGDRRSGRRASV